MKEQLCGAGVCGLGVAGVTNRDLQQRGKKERGQWHSVSEHYTHSHAHAHIHSHNHSVSSASLFERVSQWMVVCGVCVCGEPMLERARHHPLSL